MFTLLPATIVAFLLTPSIYAFRPEDRKCSTDLCLKSFKWCDLNNNADKCYFPENVHPQEDYGPGPFPALVWGKEYEIKWTTKDSKTPITIRWSFAGLGTAWEHNITDGSTSFIFQPSESMFPKGRTQGMTFHEAHGFVKDQTTLQLHQFSDPNDENSSKTTRDSSDTFTVIDGWDVKYIDYAKHKEREEGNRKLKMALGIGIPLSFVVAVIITSLITCLLAKKKTRNDSQEKGWLLANRGGAEGKEPGS